MNEKEKPGAASPQDPTPEVPRDVAEEATEAAPTATAVLPVAGIGASAGGLEVFKQLLADLPVDTGLAIIFVQHLDPKHHSLLTEILARATAMPVSEAADGMTVEANHVYVIPANVDLTVERGVLKLAPRTQAAGLHMPIDRLLRSLAAEYGSRAIGVILSGTGSDGSAGVEAIKAAGGVTFAQDLASAKFATMPEAAAATGCVDFVLPAEGIAAELVRIGRHPFLENSPLAQVEHTPAGDEQRFGAILTILNRGTGIDFTLYRKNMIKRRILRRMALRNIAGLAEYGERLAQDPGEMTALQRDLLISVTSFFRDPDSFEALKKVVFPAILRGKAANETVRVWVAGCATGEEAYSIAISFQEYLHETGAAFPIQIFASDISQESVEKARTGKYFENIAADLAPERLNRCFTKIEGGYRINKDLREMCVFTRHNLIDDPPFSKVDLISCRNVLIYLGNVQKDILPVFHYALKPSGFLMLGSSEAVTSDDLFTETDREHRIYAKRDSAKRPHMFAAAVRGSNRGAVGATAPPAPESWESTDARKEVDQILLSRYSPAGVVVDEDLEVTEIRGKASAYLTLPAGKMSFNLMKLIPDPGLFLEVEKLIEQVRRSGEPAREEHVPYEQERANGGLNVEVVPLDAGHKRSILVLFEPALEAARREGEPAEPTSEGDTKDRQISQLKQQLAEAKERFLAAIEANQTSREEIQNTTEEALSANEELQSLNEELETAKEELQSTNEELISVNDELQAKNVVLAQSRDFAMSIVETVRQPLLVLDSELRVKIANRAFCQNFHVSPQEAVGQSVFALSRGAWELPALRTSLDGLLHGSGSFPDIEVELDFPNLGHKSLVLGGCRINHLRMILVAVDDVTERKAALETTHAREEHLRQSQKMEAIGRLAGGIAHDFNNLLTAIIGYSSLIADSLGPNHADFVYVREIESAGNRAAALTDQLLAFSRRKILQPKVFDLNLVITDFERMLRRLVGEQIKIVVRPETDLWRLRADPGEIGRVVMNLCLNARDAMPSGGTLTILTANVRVGEADAKLHNLSAGRYLRMEVRDTGVGMDQEMQTHVFEPFFTTKEATKGTGLGLSTVLGIVEQSGGAIWCNSELGKGTTFKILLPAVTEASEEVDRAAGGLSMAPKGNEVILLVEDEDMVRSLARKVLETRGYVVHESRDGQEGLAFCEMHQGPIDLLLTDVVMPGLGGRELAEGALKLRPGLKVLFMSGHTQDVILKEGVAKGAPFLQKPFTPVGLAQKVREVLDAGPESAERQTAGQL